MKFFLLAWLSILSGNLLAADADKAGSTTYLEAFIGAGVYSLDDDRHLDRSYSLEGGIEYPINRFLSLEAWLSDYSADYKDESDVLDSRRYYSGALLHLKRKGKSRPFISAGFSHLRYERESGSKSSESIINVGVGLKRYYRNNVILRGELMMMNSLDKELIDVGARLALGYAFKHTPPAPIIEKPKPKPQPVVQVKQAPKPKPLPIDSDLDGVIDPIDQCPSTNIEFKVNNIGCPIMLTETVSIEMDVKFSFNSAILSQESRSEIQKIADFMAQFDKTILTVEGHSDNRGPDTYNKQLSQQRADAVRTSLITSFGLATERVSAIGFGEERPITDNTTIAGRAVNRRVVAVVESSFEREAER